MQQIKDRLKGLGMTNATIKTYCCHLNMFFKHTKKVLNHTTQEISQYLDYLMIVKNYSGRSRNLVAKIIRFYCREFENFEPELKRAKENKPIPPVCWDEYLREIIKVTPNIKHRLVLQLMRYSGLRKFEAVYIKKSHILENGMIFVMGGKGQKDRYTICPKQLLDQLQAYKKLLDANNQYMFPGDKGIGHYNCDTPREILKNAFKRLGWSKDKWFGCHALRRAFIIYALDNKIGDADEVSKWVGHSSQRTLQIYTQARRINHLSAIERYNKTMVVIQ